MLRKSTKISPNKQIKDKDRKVDKPGKIDKVGEVKIQ